MMLTKMLLILPIVVLLGACYENESEIESAVKANLKDPFSAQFRNLIVGDEENVACISWNSKNSMGGYGGWNEASLQKIDSIWVVSKMDLDSSKCTFKLVQLRDKFVEVTNEFIEKIVVDDQSDPLMSSLINSRVDFILSERRRLEDYREGYLRKRIKGLVDEIRRIEGYGEDYLRKRPEFKF